MKFLSNELKSDLDIILGYAEHQHYSDRKSVLNYYK